jgi:hypothetical protein
MAKKKAAKKAKVATVKFGPAFKVKHIHVKPDFEKPENTYKEIMRKLEESMAAEKAESHAALKTICEELFMLGVRIVTASYNGESDSGDVQYVAYDRAAGSEEPMPPELERKIKDIIWGLLPGGFENNAGGFGEVTIDVVTRKYKCEHSQRSDETFDSSDEFTF